MLPHIDGQVIVDGQFTSAKVQRVVQAIKEYEQFIEVAWIPPQARSEGQAAFRLTYEPPGEEPFILFFVNSEDEFDERVLQRIIVNDQRYSPLQLSEIEAWEQTQRLLARQTWLDELEAINDIAYHALHSPLNTYKVSPDLVIKEGIPHNAAHLGEDNKPKKGSPNFDFKGLLEK